MSEENQKRENGYYWVRHYKIWKISLYTDGLWWLGGYEFPLKEKEITEINPTRILSPDETNKK